jgi:branched-chain amino acid transport system ATP-binding protein
VPVAEVGDQGMEGRADRPAGTTGSSLAPGRERGTGDGDGGARGSAPLLSASGLCSGYGRVTVLRGVDLAVRAGEFVAVIGANGAGKTTLLRTISGILRPSAGRVVFEGRDLARIPAHRIPALGIAHVPEGRQVFPQLSVRENLLLGAYLRRDRAHREARMAFVLDLFPRLHERLGQAGGTLSGGEQQMLAVGRALMLEPRLLMLDEPSQGLAPRVVGELYGKLGEIHALGTTIVLVEQNLTAALRHADRAYVLEHGRVVLEGPTAELEGNDEIRRAYLGV